MRFFMTILGGFIATAIYNDKLHDTTNPNQHNQEETNALAEIDEFKEKAGVDPRELFKWIPPKALVYFTILLWANLGVLSLYVLRISWKSIKGVFGSLPSSGKS
ncbi:hypothetical protein N7492_003080 [Penicillium capsulatum]|uniref:Uncharacterized protein n=1 Tax=Penicillium capsulatum TaxID=69766 RepID=A0A9W9IJX5_9EURO|nr:hypothetical protein N7492_003080 [Penicillium capsulatum]KAJ6122328.1 hypothetical protein N7512_004793 [Penicillium capsulatum]